LVIIWYISAHRQPIGWRNLILIQLIGRNAIVFHRDPLIAKPIEQFGGGFGGFAVYTQRDFDPLCHAAVLLKLNAKGDPKVARCF